MFFPLYTTSTPELSAVNGPRRLIVGSTVMAMLMVAAGRVCTEAAIFFRLFYIQLSQTMVLQTIIPLEDMGWSYYRDSSLPIQGTYYNIE